MRIYFQNEHGSALITVLLAIVVVTILFTALMGIQVTEMKGQKKFEESIETTHSVVGAIDEIAFYIMGNHGKFETLSGELCIEAITKANSPYKNYVSCEIDIDNKIITVDTSISHISHKWVFDIK